MQNQNKISGTVYQGKNQVLLEIDRIARGYKSYEWATFLQWKGAGYTVRKGEKAGGHVTKFVSIDKVTRGKDGKTKTSAGHVPKGYAVFNSEQVELVQVQQYPAGLVAACLDNKY